MKYRRFLIKQEEKALQTRCANALVDAGFDVLREFPIYGSDFGGEKGGERLFIDIISGEWAFECKVDFGQSALFKALGQCMTYRAVLSTNVALLMPSTILVPRLMHIAFRDAGVPIVYENDLIQFMRNRGNEVVAKLGEPATPIEPYLNAAKQAVAPFAA